jgi:hypothetical protein
LGNLLRAAVEVPRQHGVAGAPIPRIAAQEKVLRLSIAIEAAGGLPLIILADQIITSLVLKHADLASRLRLRARSSWLSAP